VSYMRYRLAIINCLVAKARRVHSCRYRSSTRTTSSGERIGNCMCEHTHDSEAPAWELRLQYQKSQQSPWHVQASSVCAPPTANCDRCGGCQPRLMMSLEETPFGSSNSHPKGYCDRCGGRQPRVIMSLEETPFGSSNNHAKGYCARFCLDRPIPRLV
jgi:hypothetical protein